MYRNDSDFSAQRYTIQFSASWNDFVNSFCNDIFFRDVASGRTDFIPNDYYISNTAVQFFADLGVKMHDLKYNPSEQAIVLSNDDNSVKEKVDEALAELREEGILSELSAEFFGGEDVTEPLENVDELPVFEPED